MVWAINFRINKMKILKSQKLLSKTTVIYLIFTFLAFYGSALFLTGQAEDFISGELEHRFRRMERHIVKRLLRGDSLKKLPFSARVQPVKNITDSKMTVQYSDTMIYNDEAEALQRYRRKTTYVEVDNKTYKLTMVKNFGDFYQLKNEIFGALIPAFILLALVIVLFNYFLSGFLFKPFNRILRQIASYEVAKGPSIKTVKTSTREFQRMQHLFRSMIDRIEHDYRHLKEYTENMAHEIQTPLTIIRNKAENLLADERVMQRRAGDVKAIYDETNHLSRLGNTLNLLTKIENSEFSDTQKIKTKAVIEKHLEAIRESAELKSLVIKADLSDDHILDIDPFLLDIMLKNLLRNAIRYGSAEGPVTIETTDKKLCIRNYGAPLDAAEANIFKRFYRHNGSRSSLGLGLALVSKICEINQLKIDYSYQSGQHCFCISAKK